MTRSRAIGEGFPVDEKRLRLGLVAMTRLWRS